MRLPTASIWPRLIRWAIVLYCLAGIVQIRQKPGLQHDEALLVLGAVHMRHDPKVELTIPHDPDTWIRLPGPFWVPLMSARYVGAVKEYLCLPLFALFGTRTALVRLLSMLLGAIGIWGVAYLIRVHFDARVAAFAALALAINPSYVANTVFDNGTVSIFMAATGFLAVAISFYLSAKTPRGALLAAFAVGFTVGFGAWVRANFVWLAAASFAATLLTLRGRLLQIPRWHWIAAGAGAIVGSTPLIVYQVVSGGGTWQAIAILSSHDSLRDRLYVRLIGFAEALLSDREHRAMFDGAAMPFFERWLFPIGVAAAAAAGLIRREIWPRLLSLAFLFFAATLFFSGLVVAEHHLVELLPLAALLTVLAILRLPRYAAIGCAIFYLGCALQWQAAAVTGLKRTGGVGVWSDGLIPLAERLERISPGKDVKILDWGLLNNLYVVTDGRLHLRDVYGEGTAEHSGLNRSWLDELNGGGIFVLFAARRQMPLATDAFLAALQEGSPVTHRVTIPARDGTPYAEVVEVDPNTVHVGGRTHISTGDPGIQNRLDGFHQAESGGWRWAKRQFAITLEAPELQGAATVRLSVRVYLPDDLIRKLGSVTLRAALGDHSLPPETWRESGTYTYARDLNPAQLHPGPNRIDFVLDQVIPPRPGDNRELGIIVQNAGLEPVR